jgi:hypothetical protein
MGFTSFTSDRCPGSGNGRGSPDQYWTDGQQVREPLQLLSVLQQDLALMQNTQGCISKNTQQTCSSSIRLIRIARSNFVWLPVSSGTEWDLLVHQVYWPATLLDDLLKV